MVLGLIVLFGLVFGLMLFAFEDGVPFGLLKRIRCRLGWHKIHYRIGRTKIAKYYCKFCKQPRKHPVLKLVDGGNKMRDDKFKF